MQSLVDDSAINQSNHWSAQQGFFSENSQSSCTYTNKEIRKAKNQKEDLSNLSQYLNPGITAKENLKIFEDRNVKSLGEHDLWDIQRAEHSSTGEGTEWMMEMRDEHQQWAEHKQEAQTC